MISHSVKSKRRQQARHPHLLAARARIRILPYADMFKVTVPSTEPHHTCVVSFCNLTLVQAQTYHRHLHAILGDKLHAALNRKRK